MSLQKFLLAVFVCVGAYHSPPYLLRPETSVLSKASNSETKALVVKAFVEYFTAYYTFGEGKQNKSCASGRDQISRSTICEVSKTSSLTLQNQSSFCLYPETSMLNSSIVVLHNATTGSLLSDGPTFSKHYITALGRTAAAHALSYIPLSMSSSSIPVLIISSLWLYFAGSLFDAADYFLHKFSKSRYWILRRIGYLHEVHHLYFNRKLKFNDKYLWQNMCCELPLELSCQLFGTWLGYLSAQALSLTGPGLLTRELFYLILVLEIIRSFVVAVLEGRDSNHQTYPTVVPKDPHTFLVGPEYHVFISHQRLGSWDFLHLAITANHNGWAVRSFRPSYEERVAVQGVGEFHTRALYENAA